jgi:hypothetical protein
MFARTMKIFKQIRIYELRSCRSKSDERLSLLQINSWSRVHLEKLIKWQPFNKFQFFCLTWKFITVFTKSRMCLSLCSISYRTNFTAKRCVVPIAQPPNCVFFFSFIIYFSRPALFYGECSEIWQPLLVRSPRLLISSSSSSSSRVELVSSFCPQTWSHLLHGLPVSSIPVPW